VTTIGVPGRNTHVPLPAAVSIIAGAVASAIADRGLGVLKWRWEWSLARAASKQSDGEPSRRQIRKFLKRGEVLSLLSSGTEEDVEQLRLGLVQTLGADASDREMVEALADRALPAILSEFLRSLDPKSTLLVGLDRLQSDIREVAQSQKLLEAGAADVIDELVVQLPPIARGFALELAELSRRDARTLLDALVEDERGVDEAAKSLVLAPLRWLDNANYKSWLCLAEVQIGHGNAVGGATAFQRAVDAGAANPARWYARAALALLPNSEAEAFVRLSRETGGDALLALVEPIRESDGSRIVAACDDVLDSGHPDVVHVLGIRASAELHLQEWDACEKTCREQLERNDELTTARVLLATALLSRVEVGSSADATMDWREAMNQLRRCLVHDFGLALELSREAPAGEATHLEAHSPGVLGALSAAAALGRLEVVEELLTSLPDGFEKTLQAGLLAEGQGRLDDAKAAYEECVRDAASERDLASGVMALAALGADPLPRFDELRTLNPESADECLAMSLLQRGQYIEAERILRPHRTRRGIELLAQVQSAAGRPRDATATWHQAHDRFQDANSLVQAARALLRAGETDAAEAEVDNSIGLVPPGTLARTELLRLRVEIAAARDNLTDLVDRARTYLAEVPDDVPIVWALLFALNNLGRIQAAVDVLSREPTLMPATEQEARLYLSLSRQLDPSDEVAMAVVRVGREFERDEAVWASAILVVLELTRNLSMSPSTAASIKELIDDFVTVYPDSDYFKRLDFNSIDDLAELVHKGQDGREAAVSEAVRRVEDDMFPQGILAVYADRTYLDVVLRRGAGFSPISSGDPGISEREMAAAEASLDQQIVLDATALASLSLVPERWPDVVSAFDSIAIDAISRLDIESTSTDLNRRSTLSIGWDSSTERPVATTITEAEAEDLALRSSWIAERTDEVPLIRDAPAIETRIDPKDPQAMRFLPWVRPIELARALGVALMSDDVGQRLIAQSEGVAAFGSVSLFEVLDRTGRLSPAGLASTRIVFLENWCVDLKPSEGELLGLGDDAEWRGGPAALFISRRSFWQDPSEALKTAHRVLGRVHEHAPTQLVAWVSAVLRGVAKSQFNDMTQRRVSTNILEHAVILSGPTPESLAALVRASRLVTGPNGRPDSLIDLAQALFEGFERVVTAAAALAEVMRLVRGLDESDRRDVLRHLIQPQL
jgi:tetratricopeptide (TPR) repeat protein